MKRNDAAYQAELRRSRFARRVWVAGQLIAPLPTERHGSCSTYSNWGCRCRDCRAAFSAYQDGCRAARAAS